MKSIRLAVAAVFYIAIMLLSLGCSAPVSQEKLNDAYNRLELVDEFYEQNVPEFVDDPVSAQPENTFRSIPFGTLRIDVINSEKLAVLEEYSNAVDYIPISVFGFDMIPTYWFNSFGELYRGSYYMRSDVEFEKLIGRMMIRLNDIYSQSVYAGYYDYDGLDINIEEHDNLLEMVHNKEAYYYASFYDSEVYVELKIYMGNDAPDNSSYDVFILFTDYSYDL